MSPALLLVAAIGAAPQAELLDFTATWCGPCQQMNPIVERLQQEGWPVRQIDVDQHQDLVRRYKINGIPAFVLVVNGQEVDRVVGGTSEAKLRQMLAKIPASTDGGERSATPQRRGWFKELLGGDEARHTQPVSAPAESNPSPPEFTHAANVRGQTPADRPNPSASAATASAPSAGKPLETAVRIRVTNEKGTDFGSGTLIGSREGAALVLTCWHIFREFGESADVLVDVFPNGPDAKSQTFPGKLIKHDEKADVALVAVTGCGVLPVSPIASADNFPEAGDHVFSVGCGDGKPPSLEQHAVTRLNPYQGPGTTECTGLPIVGRSGGGLFDSSGRVIGVCFAADKADHRGVYVGPEEIHKLLRLANYGSLIPATGTPEVEVVDSAEPAKPGSVGLTEEPHSGDGMSNPFEIAATSPVSGSTRSNGEPGAAAPRPREGEFQESRETAGEASDVATATPRGLPPAVETALASGSAMEATVILRPLDDSNEPSRVIVINRISGKFRRYLTGEVEGPPVETGLHVPKLDRARLTTADLVVATPSDAYVRSVGSRQSHRSCDVALLVGVFNNRSLSDRR